MIQNFLRFSHCYRKALGFPNKRRTEGVFLVPHFVLFIWNMSWKQRETRKRKAQHVFSGKRLRWFCESLPGSFFVAFLVRRVGARDVIGTILRKASLWKRFYGRYIVCCKLLAAAISNRYGRYVTGVPTV